MQLFPTPSWYNVPMNVHILHSWNVSPSEAISLQKRLAERVSHCSTLTPNYRLVAGVDVACSRFSNHLFAGVVVCDRKNWEVIETAEVATETSFPYIPGLLSFREAPGVLEAFDRLRCRPDVVLVDGAGFAHPRRFGLACHLGVLLNLPTIGVAKSRLIGNYREPALRRGSATRLVSDGETIGRVVRTRAGVRPLFVSIGHRISLDEAVRVVLASTSRYRLPEPIRAAHQHVGSLCRRSRCKESHA
jgi:deoxyribonuclease V